MLFQEVLQAEIDKLKAPPAVSPERLAGQIEGLQRAIEVLGSSGACCK